MNVEGRHFGALRLSKRWRPLASADPLSDLDGFAAGFAPGSAEDGEPLLVPALHHRAVIRRIAARNVVRLACREHLLNGILPSHATFARHVHVAPAATKHAAKRTGAREQDSDALHRSDLLEIGESL